MVKALRVTTSGEIPFEHVEIYTSDDYQDAPNIFEDSQIMLKTKDGSYLVPDYNILLIQLRTGKPYIPSYAHRVSRILLAWSLNFQDCYIINQEDYDRYGIPQIFKDYEQLAFICKDGLFITPDYNVYYIKI